MSNKRFTDSKKWRNEWFRTLPLKAKLVWVYLCDECEFTGVFKIDYGLASFQLGFDITPTLIGQWFLDKVFFFNDGKIFIVPFFEFQYGESKDSWTAKARAKQKIEALGFKVENNKILINPDSLPPQSDDCGTTGLIIDKGEGEGEGKVNSNKEEVKNFEKEIELLYKNLYPLKKGKSKGVKKLAPQITSQLDLDNLAKAIGKYKKSLSPGEFVLHFSTFATTWTDWLDDDAGTAEHSITSSYDVSYVWGKP